MPTYVGERASFSTTGGSGTTQAIPLASSCTAGNTLILLFAARDTSVTGVSVADSRSNTWTVDAGPVNTANDFVMIASTRMNAGTLLSGDTVTVTFGTAPNEARIAMLEEFSGLASSSYVDKTTSSGTTSGVLTGSTGTTATTTQASELAIAAFNIGGSTYNEVVTPDSTYSQFTTLNINDNALDGFPKTLAGQYKILTATGTQSCTLSWSISGSYQGLIVTYKAGVTTQNGAAALSGTGAASSSGLVTKIGTAPLSGTGAASSTGVSTVFGSASLSGSGSTSIAAQATYFDSASLTGSGSSSTAGVLTKIGSASLAGSGTATGSGIDTALGAASLSGIGSMSATPAGGTILGTANLTGTGSTASAGIVTKIGSASLAGSGSSTTAGVRTSFGIGSLVGIGSSSTNGVRTSLGNAVLSGLGVLAATGIREIVSQALLEALGTLSADGLVPSKDRASASATGIVGFITQDADTTVLVPSGTSGVLVGNGDTGVIIS